MLVQFAVDSSSTSSILSGATSRMEDRSPRVCSSPSSWLAASAVRVRDSLDGRWQPAASERGAASSRSSSRSAGGESALRRRSSSSTPRHQRRTRRRPGLSSRLFAVVTPIFISSLVSSPARALADADLIPQPSQLPTFLAACDPKHYYNGVITDLHEEHLKIPGQAAIVPDDLRCLRREATAFFQLCEAMMRHLSRETEPYIGTHPECDFDGTDNVEVDLERGTRIVAPSDHVARGVETCSLPPL